MSYQQDQQKSPQKRFLFVFGFVRIAFFIALGLLIISNKLISTNLAPEYRYMLGGALILYAIGRLFIEFNSRRRQQ